MFSSFAPAISANSDPLGTYAGLASGFAVTGSREKRRLLNPFPAGETTPMRTDLTTKIVYLSYENTENHKVDSTRGEYVDPESGAFLCTVNPGHVFGAGDGFSPGFTQSCGVLASRPGSYAVGVLLCDEMPMSRRLFDSLVPIGVTEGPLERLSCIGEPCDTEAGSLYAVAVGTHSTVGLRDAGRFKCGTRLAFAHDGGRVRLVSLSTLVRADAAQYIYVGEVVTAGSLTRDTRPWDRVWVDTCIVPDTRAGAVSRAALMSGAPLRGLQKAPARVPPARAGAAVRAGAGAGVAARAGAGAGAGAAGTTAAISSSEWGRTDYGGAQATASSAPLTSTPSATSSSLLDARPSRTVSSADEQTFSLDDDGTADTGAGAGAGAPEPNTLRQMETEVTSLVEALYVHTDSAEGKRSGDLDGDLLARAETALVRLRSLGVNEAEHARAHLREIRSDGGSIEDIVRAFDAEAVNDYLDDENDIAAQLQDRAARAARVAVSAREHHHQIVERLDACDLYRRLAAALAYALGEAVGSDAYAHHATSAAELLEAVLDMARAADALLGEIVSAADDMRKRARAFSVAADGTTGSLEPGKSDDAYARGARESDGAEIADDDLFGPLAAYVPATGVGSDGRDPGAGGGAGDETLDDGSDAGDSDGAVNVFGAATETAEGLFEGAADDAAVRFGTATAEPGADGAGGAGAGGAGAGGAEKRTYDSFDEQLNALLTDAALTETIGPGMLAERIVRKKMMERSPMRLNSLKVLHMGDDNSLRLKDAPVKWGDVIASLTESLSKFYEAYVRVYPGQDMTEELQEAYVRYGRKISAFRRAEKHVYLVPVWERTVYDRIKEIQAVKTGVAELLYTVNMAGVPQKGSADKQAAALYTAFTTLGPALKALLRLRVEEEVKLCVDRGADGTRLHVLLGLISGKIGARHFAAGVFDKIMDTWAYTMHACTKATGKAIDAAAAFSEDHEDAREFLRNAIKYASMTDPEGTVDDGIRAWIESRHDNVDLLLECVGATARIFATSQIRKKTWVAHTLDAMNANLGVLNNIADSILVEAMEPHAMDDASLLKYVRGPAVVLEGSDGKKTPRKKRARRGKRPEAARAGSAEQ